MMLRPLCSTSRETTRLERNQSPLLPPRDGHIVALRGTGVELARAPDLLVRVFDHFLPLRNPADRAGNREQHGEHRGRKTHSHERDARMKVEAEVKHLRE